MGMVAPQQRIASAFVVFCGSYGAVLEHARQRGVCRQWHVALPAPGYALAGGLALVGSTQMAT